MTIAQRIADAQTRYAEVERSVDFIQIARCLLAGKGTFQGARDHAAIQPGLSDRVRKLLADPSAINVFVQRATVPGMGLGDLPQSYAIAASAWAGSLSNSGLFDRLLNAGFRKLPMSLVTTGAIGVGAVAAVVEEFGVKPISSLSLSSATSTPRKAAALLVMTAELLRAVENAADTIISAELKKAVIAAIDGKLISIASSGAPLFASTGANLAAFFTDLANALNAVATDQNSRLYIAMTPANVKQLSLMLASGSATTTALSPTGGTILGMEVIPCSALGSGTWLLIDATGFAAASDMLFLSTLRSSTIQFAAPVDSPPTPATPTISMFQMDQLGLLCERWFFCERLRASAVAQITGASYAPGGFSP